MTDVMMMLFRAETVSHWKAAGHLWSAQRLVTKHHRWMSTVTLMQASLPRTGHSLETTAQTRDLNEVVVENTRH